MTQELNYILITNDVTEAEIYAKANVSRIMIDLEINGKDARQGHLDTVISRHSVSDIKPVKQAIAAVEGTTSKLLVRVNPYDEATSKAEIDEVIAEGAEYIMLPMFTTVDEVKSIAEIIDGRVKLVLLCEHYKALDCLDDILTEVKDVDEVHLGLNDLRISIGYNFLFSAFIKGYSEKFASIMQKHGKPYGMGGVSAIGFGDLPAEKILTEHAKVGSTRVILSRHFKSVVFKDGISKEDTVKNLIEETDKLSAHYAKLLNRSEDEVNADYADMAAIIEKIENR
tara:strand:+ start:7478 stop:8326 length:849 start_codon:yes stop_codon:yes gene_type:complete